MSEIVFKSILAHHYKSGMKEVHYHDAVDHCPYCKYSMALSPEKANFTLPYNSKFLREDSLYLTYQCRKDGCQKVFVAVFKHIYDGNRPPFHMHILSKIIPALAPDKEWPEEVRNISTDFSEIYNQALACEFNGFNYAAGPAYRKSLEFLIKDYLIKNNPGKESEIKNKLLGNCINEYIDNFSIKECAKRASWIGNDETHYLRKWIDKDISDLKTLIQLTVNHIQTELLTRKYLEEMI